MEQLVLHFLENKEETIIALQINTYIIKLLQGQKNGEDPLKAEDQNQPQGDLQLFNDYFSKSPVYWLSFWGFFPLDCFHLFSF